MIKMDGKQWNMDGCPICGYCLICYPRHKKNGIACKKQQKINNNKVT